jgi:broad specificity phosphatase PhoE
VLARLELVRHGEVHNPRHLVYASLPGFGLSEAGLEQARAIASRLAADPPGVVVSSPLERAVQTAAPIADAAGVPLRTDERLIEWRLLDRWAGVVWGDLAETHPGETEAYLATPHDLPFSPEPIEAVARRMASVVADLGIEFPGGHAAVVSHQDPVQALRLHLTGRSLARLGRDKPGHGTVLTLRPEWVETERWDPPA